MFILDLLFPKSCFGCGRLGSYVCKTCEGMLSPSVWDICFYCQKPSFLGFTHPACKKPYGVDQFVFLYRYNTYLKKIIKGIKYRLVTQATREFYLLMCKEIVRKKIKIIHLWKEGDYILNPIPLSVKRQRKRGFNQSLLFGSMFSSHFGLSLVECFERVKDTIPQAQLEAKKRKSNIGGVFYIKEKVVEKNIILFDDVVTTGSTVKEAAEVLKKAGVKKVSVFSIAKG